MTRKRIRNWSQYNRALVNQGSIIFWIKTSDAKTWFAKQEGTRGRPQVYSRQAILALLIVRVVFRCAFRQLQGLMRDFLQLLDVGAVCPDYSTICRRARHLKVPVKAHCKGPLVVVFDSTGLKVYGEGEWQVRKHGPSYRRGWKKIHIGMCAETQQIVAASLSDKHQADSQELPKLLDSITADIDQVIGDGAYDAIECYKAIHRRGAKPIIPPRKGAKPSGSEPALRSRDQAIHRIRDQKRGKRRWKKEIDYHRRSLVETAMYRIKVLTGRRMRARLPESQIVELSLRIHVLNEMMNLTSC